MLGGSGPDTGDGTSREYVDHVYAWCALLYHWKPDEVDAIPVRTLMRIMRLNSEWIREIIDSVGRSIPKI